MPFTKALYYPWIDIKDEAWLKNAMLYWDKIQTIVPASIEQPYSTRTAREFSDEGLLIPYHVEPNMGQIDELTNDVLKYLESTEGAEVLMLREISRSDRIHPNKLPRDIQELVEIHPEKLPRQIKHTLQDAFSGTQRHDWISVDSRFANFYMTLLATRLSETIGAGLLTNTTTINKLATAARLDAKLDIPRSRRHTYHDYDDYSEHMRHRDRPLSLAQGTLADLILERIQIDTNTPVKKILKFRNDYADELGRFRTEIAKLTETISNKQLMDAPYQHIEDIYTNEIGPAYNSLKKGLTSNRITWATKSFIKVAFFSTVSSLPLTLLGLSVPHALLAGAGISLTASAVLYNHEKAEILRQNPFSYVLAVEKVFH